MQTSLPFRNEVVALTISGKTLKKVFEHSVQAFFDSDKNGKFLQMAGMYNSAFTFSFFFSVKCFGFETWKTLNSLQIKF